MKTIKVRFEADPSIDYIDVLVRSSERDAEAEALMERVYDKPPNFITVTDAQGVQCRITADSVISVSVTGKQAQFVTEDGSYTARQSLQSLEGALDDGQFVRISRYELINMEKIEKYDFTANGTLRLELAGGIETWASRRCIPEVRRRIRGREK